MSKEELRELIRNTTDETILKALWELYDSKEKEVVITNVPYPTYCPTYCPTKVQHLTDSWWYQVTC